MKEGVLSNWDFRDADEPALIFGDVRQAPYIKDDSAEALKEKEGITSIWQYFGKFLEFGRDKEKFKQLLKDAGVNAGNVGRATDAVSNRMLNLGFVVKVPLPDNLKASTRINDTQMAMFLKFKLTRTDLEDDFRGLGENTAKELAKAGITNSDQLFAKLLSFCGEPKYIQPETKAQAMYEWMQNDVGITGGWIPTIIDQLVAKLGVGIDSGIDKDPKTE